MRDVLVHLSEWHRLLIDWINANMNGAAASFLPERFNWRTYPQMNIEFWKKHQTTSYTDAAAALQKTHAEALLLIETFSNDELFAKNAFAWTVLRRLAVIAYRQPQAITAGRYRILKRQ